MLSILFFFIVIRNKWSGKFTQKLQNVQLIASPTIQRRFFSDKHRLLEFSFIDLKPHIYNNLYKQNKLTYCIK